LKIATTRLRVYLCYLKAWYGLKHAWQELVFRVLIFAEQEGLYREDQHGGHWFPSFWIAGQWAIALSFLAIEVMIIVALVYAQHRT
jgi:hypothetical protein